MADQGDTNDTDATTTETPAPEEAVTQTEQTPDDPGNETDSTTILEGAGTATDKDEGNDADESEKDAEGSDAKDGEEEDGEKEGAPEAYDLKPPEGVEFDDELIERFTPAFKELDLSNEQAQKLADLLAEHQQHQQEAQDAQHAEQRKAWKDEFAKLPSSPELAAKAKRTIDKFVKEQDPDTYDLLTQTWLGDHPGIVQAFARIGAVIGEDTFAGSGGSGRVKDARAIYPSMKNP